MATYLLDTNTISYLADHASPFHRPTTRRLAELPEESEIAVSLLTLYELTYGFLHDPAHGEVPAAEPKACCSTWFPARLVSQSRLAGCYLDTI
jgi:predicted nucleic acid-binding protein